MTVKGVLFDIDGTLVDSNDMHVLAWEEAFERVGARFSREAIHAQIGKGADMLLPALLPSADEAMHEKAADAHGEIFKSRYLGEVMPFPQARDLLVRVCEAGQKVVLASSASAEELEHHLQLLDARDLVGATTSADDVERTKPAPDIFAAATRKVGLRHGEAVVVGDTPYDMEAAGRCGIAGVAVRSGGFAEAVLLGAGAVALYDDVASLLRDYDRSPLAAAIPT
jgi:phosphoglycolate phosphatase-like HAD superfamily hydrolase